MRNTNPALGQAYALDRQGRLPEAIAAYRKLLESEPQNSDALHLLGVAMARSGRGDEAVRAISTAAELQPDNPSIQTNLGNVLNELGRHAEAVEHFTRALALKPDLVAAAQARGRTLLLLGRAEEALQGLQAAARLAPGNPNIDGDLAVAQIAARKLTEALASLDRVLNADPRRAVAHALRGNVLSDLGRMTEALESYNRALALQPGDAVTLRNRGRVLMTLQRPDEALAGFDAAIRAQDVDAESHFYRGVALAKLGRHADALPAFERALELGPDTVEIINNRGIALAELDRQEEAARAFDAALDRNPTHLEALENAANTARVLQRYQQSLQLFDRALALQPDNPQLRLGKGLLLLTLGDYEQGWPLHEARHQLSLPSIESLRDTTVLVHAEQGLGDTVQFCRYVPMLEARGVQVTFAVQPALQLLLRSLSPTVQILPYDQSLPAHSHRLPLLSLPMLFGTRAATIPAAVPYLSALPKWREQLQVLPGLKVGIAWQGNVETEKQGGFRGRSFTLAQLAPLAALGNVTLISLQKGPGARQKADFKVIELTDPDYMGPEEMLDTAALIQELDLVVSSDTVTAHLAGALGVPTWVALSTSSDWRWLTEREDTPWYPNMRLFRQRSRGQWAPVFERIAGELAEYRGRAG